MTIEEGKKNREKLFSRVHSKTMFSNLINDNRYSQTKFSIDGNGAILSDAEIEILSFFRKDSSSKGLAELTNKAVKTIDWHINNIKRKTNVYSRSGLQRLADKIF